MLKLADVHAYYGDSHVLNGISLEVGHGSVVALLGRNGMGKTTTLRSIMGLTVRYGTITFGGKDLTKLQTHQIARMGIALVPQGRRIFSSLSVKENLAISARGGGKSNAWSLDRVYTSFPILRERTGLRGTLLSGGEQQMLAVARALMNNPDLLLMDEPSEGLAPLLVREVGRIIAQLNDSGISVLLAEQNLRLALEVADYVYVLSKGEIVYQSSLEDFKNNEEVKNRYLGLAK